MKTMFVSDYLNIRNTLLQLCGICIIIAVFMSVAMESIAAAAAALAAMIPFMTMFTLASLDEKDGWEKFRLTLPMTRKQVVAGRYVFIGTIAVAGMLFSFIVSYALFLILPLISLGDGLDVSSDDSVPVIIGAVVGAASVVILAISIAQPLVMRYGMTKATRIVPMFILLGICALVAFTGNSMENVSFLQSTMQWLDAGNNYLFLAIGIIIADIVIYAISALVAVNLYKNRAL